MNERESTKRRGFWPLALLWLPVGVVTTTAFRFMPERTPSEMTGMWLQMVLMAAPSLIVVAPCGLPLALACRRLWWLGFHRAAWGVGAALGQSLSEPSYATPPTSDQQKTQPRHTATQIRPIDHKSSDIKWPREMSETHAMMF